MREKAVVQASLRPKPSAGMVILRAIPRYIVRKVKCNACVEQHDPLKIFTAKVKQHITQEELAAIDEEVEALVNDAVLKAPRRCLPGSGRPADRRVRLILRVITMTIKTYREAVKEALAQEMERDERVVLIGEDLRGGHGGNAPEEAKIEAFGGVLGVTKGLWTQFGSDRVIDTPITESAIIGMAAGAAAATGLRPVAELMFMDFFWCEPRCTV